MRHSHARAIRFLTGPLTLLTMVGCGDSSGPRLPEDRGVLLVGADSTGFSPGDLIWTKDGAHVVYVAVLVSGGNVPIVLNAVNIVTHAVRQLNRSSLILSLARGSAGDRIYFGTQVTTPGTSDAVYQLNRIHPVSGILETLATNPIGSDNRIVVSPNERFVAIGSRLLDLQTGTVSNLPLGAPIEFSPDGTQLFYELYGGTNSNQVTTLISTTDGSSRPLHSTDTRQVAYRWEGNTPQMLLAGFELDGRRTYAMKLSEIDGVTGATRDVAQFSETSGVVSPMGWSPDGRTLAVWVAGSDYPVSTALYVVRPGSAPAVVARVNITPGPPVFSPDGHSIVYSGLFENDTRSVYLKSGL